jgi:general secretion pathway protein K
VTPTLACLLPGARALTRLLMWRRRSSLPRQRSRQNPCDSSRRSVLSSDPLTSEAAALHRKTCAASRDQRKRSLPERGSALVAVLWLSAAVSVIALALAAQVRNEVERASAYSQSLRAYYLATGSIQRALLWMQWGPSTRQPDGSAKYYQPPAPRMLFSYPDGFAVVEVIPESAKLSLNGAKPEEIAKLMLALGAPPQRAQLLTAAIVDWRAVASGAPGEASPFDTVYRASSFLAPHASFRQLEELLLVRGMTTDLFYGHFGPNATGEMVYYPGLRDCVTTYTGGTTQFDVNSVPVPVLEAIGWPANIARALEVRRARIPFKSVSEIAQFVPPELMARVGLGGGNFITLRATSSLRTPDGRPAGLKRTVSVVFKSGATSGVVSTDPRQWVILRWYDNEASPVLPQAVFAAPAALSAFPATTTVIGAAGDAPAASNSGEPVRVYRQDSTDSAASPQAAPAAPAAPDKNATTPPATGKAPPKEVLKVYHVSGSGAVEETPQAPKQQP